MSSLAFSAASFESEEPKTQSMVQRRKNKTHKNTNNMTDKSYYSDKVNNVLSKIHNKIHSDNGDDFDDSYENFEPISPPVPMKVPKKENNPSSEGYSNYGDNNTNKVISQMQSTPYYKVSANSDSSLPDPQYPYYPYPDMMETMNRFKKQERTDTFPMVDQTLSYPSSYDGNNKLLMEKLNYMIHLLEENHDEQTNNVIEEVILYSFLGIFIIFLIDNFIKVGRYVR